LNRSSLLVKVTGTTCGVFLAAACFAQPPAYKGKPFADDFHKSGPQTIPGTVQAALYDLGGEGIAYHDTDAVNHGSGDLNYTQGCQPGTSPYICHFREKEGVDISYIKDRIDLAHNHSSFRPDREQLYIGWAADGEWTNYTVDVKNAGSYTVYAVYQGQANTFQFSIDNKPAAVLKFPIDMKGTPLTDEKGWHNWNKAVVGQITFPEKGLHLLTLHYNAGDGFAYFEFVLNPDSSEWLQQLKK